MEADQITPWHEGGKTNAENCQMLCKEDNRGNRAQLPTNSLNTSGETTWIEIFLYIHSFGLG